MFKNLIEHEHHHHNVMQRYSTGTDQRDLYFFFIILGAFLYTYCQYIYKNAPKTKKT